MSLKKTISEILGGFKFNFKDYLDLSDIIKYLNNQLFLGSDKARNNKEYWAARTYNYITELNQYNALLREIKNQTNFSLEVDLFGYLPYEIIYGCFQQLFNESISQDQANIERFCDLNLVRRLKSEIFNVKLELNNYYGVKTPLSKVKN